MSAGFGEHPVAPATPDDRDPHTGARPYAAVYQEIRDQFAVEVAEAAANAAIGQQSAAAFLAQGGPGSGAGRDVVEPGPA